DFLTVSESGCRNTVNIGHPSWLTSRVVLSALPARGSLRPGRLLRMPTVQSFPRHNARTQGFTLGAPRNLTVTPAGDAVLFLRSASGTDRSTGLWKVDTDTGEEHLLADPAALRAPAQVTAEEQARRERARERATGITGYAIDGTG